MKSLKSVSFESKQSSLTKSIETRRMSTEERMKAILERNKVSHTVEEEKDSADGEGVLGSFKSTWDELFQGIERPSERGEGNDGGDGSMRTAESKAVVPPKLFKASSNDSFEISESDFEVTSKHLISAIF